MGTYNVCYDVVALVLLLVIILLYFMKRGIPNYQNRLFLLLIFCALVAAIFDIADVTFINAGSKIPNWMKYISSGGCYVLQMFEALLVFYYVLGITTTWKETKFYVKAATIIPFMIASLLTFTTYFTHLLFYYDEQGNYIRGEGRIISVLVGIFYLVLAVVRIWLLKKSFTFETRVTLWIVTLIGTTGVVVQTLMPKMITQIFGVTLCLLIIFFTLQNPFLAIDSDLRAYNRSIFITMTSYDFAAKKQFSVIIIMLDDISFLQRNLGIEHVRALQRSVVDELRRTEEGALIFHINDSCFCMVFNQLYSQRIDEIMGRILKKFDKPWMIHDISTLLSAHLCRVECPQDAANVKEILDVVSCLGEDTLGSRIVSASDLRIRERNQHKQREQLIRDAVEYSKFDVCYRKIYSIAQKKAVSAEIALCVIGENGLIYSSECKDLLEKTGLSFRVGIYLFRRACDYLTSAQRAGQEIESVEIGISIFMCMHQKFLDEIIWLMKEYKISPGTIRLKITESEALDSSHQLQEMMKKFSDAGIWFSLDGYGTGYTNISYIYELPFSHVELSREVFAAALADEQAMSILKNTIHMLHELDMQVVVCETQKGMSEETLREIQSDYTIGFYQQL
ncbi:MAG: GGDEF domain-containing protein [bacterium]|nr:GGDEF domain-containing protein [bacterium]